MNTVGLERFIKAQEDSYERALGEIRNGRKQSHWMWYIFPQIKGLGFSATAQYYAIQDKKEAEDYMNHFILGKRLIEISQVLLDLSSSDAREVMGYPDDMKLRSSMTLFYLVSGQTVFMNVLEKFFDGEIDWKTAEIIKQKV